MKNLLSAKTLRYLKIIDITRETGVVTFDMIQAVNSSSKNTVYADLEFMREQWGEFLDIRVNKNNIFISNNAMRDFIEVRKELFRNEIGIRFLSNIFENPTHTIVDHALDLSYSESHLRKIVIEINKFMKQFKSEVVYNQNNALVYTTTSEGHLNYAIAEIIKFSDLEPTLPTVDRQAFAKF
ncbi:helix-turn-helix domain-containing protein [Erysipelothrix sp. D19-032]